MISQRIPIAAGGARGDAMRTGMRLLIAARSAVGLRRTMGMVMLACVLGCSAAASARAATFPLTSDGELPRVAIEPTTGKGHFVWVQDRPPAAQKDVVHYCQIPRGASACQNEKTFVRSGAAEGAAGEIFHPASILLRDQEVVILFGTCCEHHDGTWLTRSLDGGATFSAVRQVGDIQHRGEAQFGPNEFQVSWIGATSLSTFVFQSSTLDGVASGKAVLEEGVVSTPYARIAFPTPAKPITVAGTDGTLVLRAWKGTGNINDVGTWTPRKPIGPGSDFRLVNGPRGVFMTYYRDLKFYLSRYVQPAAGAPASDPGGFEPPREIFTQSSPSASSYDFYQDSTGRLHLTFFDTASSTRAQMHVVSEDGGQTFSPPQAIAAEAQASYVEDSALAADGAGFAVGEQSQDVSIVTTIPPRAAKPGGPPPSLTPPQPKDLPDGACVPAFQQGIVSALASKGCFRKQGTKLIATGDFRLNGIDFVRPGQPGAVVAASARAAQASQVVIDYVSGVVTTSGPAMTVRLKDAVLGQVPKTGFTLPKAPNKRILAFSGVQRLKSTVLGFGLTGDADVYLQNGRAYVDTHLELPKIFQGITADVRLEAVQPSGLVLRGFTVKIPDANLLALKIKDFVISYQTDLADAGGAVAFFSGSAKFLLPPLYDELASGAGSFALKENALTRRMAFHEAGARIPLKIPLVVAPPPSAPIPVVRLSAVEFKVGEDPFRIEGGATFGFGPGADIMTINGKLYASFGTPQRYGITGALAVFGVSILDGSLHYSTDGKIGVAGQLKWGLPNIASLNGRVAGFADFDREVFNLEGAVEACILDAACANIAGVVSSRGIAACASADAILASGTLGIGYNWKTKEHDIFGDIELGGGAECDISPWRVADTRTVRAAQAGGPSRVRISAGKPFAVIGVTGAGGAPRIALKRPDGGVLVASANPAERVRDTKAAIYSIPSKGQSFVALKRPAAGVYEIDTVPGSVPIQQIHTADGLPEPRVRVKVTGRGHKRRLAYTIKNAGGRKITFLEQRGDLGSQLGTARGTRGAIRFAPAHGRGGRRKIVAVFGRDGIDYRRRTVGSYKAPRPRKLGKPRRVRVVRSKNGLRVVWAAVRRARSYEVRIKLRDGTSRLLSTRRREVSLKDVQRTDAGSITVRAIDWYGARGPRTPTKLRGGKLPVCKPRSGMAPPRCRKPKPPKKKRR